MFNLVSRIAVAFGIIAFVVALIASLFGGADIGAALARSGIAAVFFVVLGGILSFLLLMFFPER